MNKRKILVLLLIAVGGAGLYYGYCMYNMEHVSLEELPADVNLEADQLMAEFAEDEAAANQLYLDKVIQVTGEVSEVVNSEAGLTVFLNGGQWGMVQCAFANPIEIVPDIGTKIEVRGRCSGYLLDVVLNDCVVVTN